MSPTPKSVAAALGFSAVACALSLYAAVVPASPQHSVDPADEVLDRLHGIEERLAELERRSTERTTPVLGVSSSGAERMPADLDARLDKLEAELSGNKKGSNGDAAAATEVAATGTAPDGTQLTKSGRPKRGTPQHLEWARQRVLDPNLSAMERSEALGEVQKHGAEAYTEEIVQAMVVIGQTHEDPEVRENVWRQFDGATNPTLAVALRQALATDAAPGVRREAAEALDRFRDDPAVRAALEHAAQHDPDEKVRWEALRSLRKPMKSRSRAEAATPPGGGNAAPSGGGN
ncbi:MAG TPA: HEAT repeat domain-containing protein [Planctomycetota bacterium]|nr:HEAT repeat domain-containing protein [Planctomycetota bacterium]